MGVQATRFPRDIPDIIHSREGNVTTRKQIFVAGSLIAAGLLSTSALAGPMGSELDLGITPAGGGMEGVGLALPQGNVSMLFGNPSTLGQLKGSTSFTFGGAYISPSLKADGTIALPNPAGPTTMPPVLLPFQGASRLTDLAAPHAAVLQRISPDTVVAMGFTGISGLGSDWRNVLPPSFSLIADLKLFGGTMGFSHRVADNLYMGGSFTLGIGSLQVGTVPSTGSVNNFGIGGTMGMTYQGDVFTVSGAYKTELAINYKRVLITQNILDPTVTPADAFSNFKLEQPREFMFGIGTDKVGQGTMMEVDFRWKNYSNSKGYSSFWRNQWKIAFGAQQELPNGMVVRGGYSYSRAIAKDASQLGGSFGGVSQLFAPGFPGQAFGLAPNVAPVTPGLIQLVQATIADGHWQQGVSFGFGMKLMPNLRLDLNVNYAFDGKLTLNDPNPSGQSINVNGKLLATGMGLTWTFN